MILLMIKPQETMFFLKYLHAKMLVYLFLIRLTCTSAALVGCVGQVSFKVYNR